jgi:hypothetical protein
MGGDMSFEFLEFPKMARLSREIIVTEKLDGTNAQVFIRPKDNDDGTTSALEFGCDCGVEHDGKSFYVRAGSRTRWLTIADDNFGFAKWVYQNASELVKLGVGRHYGEWWGSGIQRAYGLEEKRFSLFNVTRWEDQCPACCHVVPSLYIGPFNTECVEGVLDGLSKHGSVAAPGFMKPEGVVVWHTAANIGFKKTIEKDEMPKSVSMRSK